MNTTGSPMAILNDCSGALTNTEIVVLSTMNAILGLASLFGNGLILAAIYRVQNQRSVSNAFIGSMSVADFTVGLFMNPLWVAKSVLNIWESDNQLSTVIEVLTMQTIVATTLSLCAVSTDRYIAVTKMRYNEIMTWKRVRIIIVSIWIFSILFACLRLIITDPFQLPKLWLAATAITVITPLTLISVCYYFIFKAARLQIRRISAEETFNPDEAIVQLKNRKAAFTIGIIVGVFTICWTPSLVISLVQFFTSDLCKKTRINGYWFWGALAEFSNSAFNPFIYCIRSREFRKAVKKAISCHQL
ncbi:beta-1 adrenergic receptor-like [Oculina patagonica]